MLKMSEKKKNALLSYMLIDTENSASLLLANSLNYEIFQTWNFYSIDPKINPNHNVYFENLLIVDFTHIM